MKEKNIERKLEKYILPNTLAMIGISLYILADTFFISIAQGTFGITALNLTLPIYGLIFAIGAMIGVGSATRFSLSKYKSKDNTINYFSNGLIWSIIIGMIFVVVGVLFPDVVLKSMGADDTIVDVGKNYLRIAMCFAPIFMMNYSFTSFVRNDNSPKIAMFATLTSSLFNIVFDYILMFPLGMGMIGAALATGFSPVVSMLICLIHYLSKRNTIKFHIKVPSIKKLGASCAVGFAAFIGEISSGITTMAFNFILLSLSGNIGVAAYGIVANIALVGTSIFNGVSQGLQPMASKFCSKNDYESEKRIYRHSLIIAEIIAVILVALICIFAKEAVSIFNSEKSVALENIAVPGLRIYFIGFLFAGINIIRSGFFSAIGCGKESSIIAILRGVVAIVIFAFLLSKVWGITGVFFAFVVTEIVVLIITLRLGKNQKPAI